jgi:adhesin transport system membrane fusion protein
MATAAALVPAGAAGPIACPLPRDTGLETLGRRVRPARAAQAMLWSIIGFSALMIGWAGVARVSETATAAGRVVSQRPLQVISNLEGGTIAAILARPGQHVAPGQVLVRLDPGIATADFGRTSAATDALAARIARLEAEASGAPLVFPVGLAATAPQAVAAETALFAAHRADLSANAAGDSARVDAAARALDGARANSAAMAEVRAQAARETAMVEPLVERGIQPAMRLSRARSAQIQAEAAEAAAGDAVRHAAASLAEAQANRAAMRGRFGSATADALAAARADLAAQSAALPALRTRMARTAITSPIAGTVQRVLVTTPGSAVAPGAPLVEVVPAGGALAVEAEVRPADIGFIHQGQRASVRLTAYDSSVYGTLPGRVDRISPDAITNERSGESHFIIRVTTAATGLRAPDGMLLPIGPGMIAEVDLIGRKRTILSYLLSPVTKLRENAFRER